MENKFIYHFDFRKLTDLISDAKELIYLSIPNIHDELCETIITYKISNRVKDVRILLDNSERNYRNGYGEISAVKKLAAQGIEIYELKGNMISFIIVDGKGYYLFPQSRIFSSDDDLTSNAVSIDPISIFRLINYFFSPSQTISAETLNNQLIDKFEDVKRFMNNAQDDIMTEKEFKTTPLLNTDIQTVDASLRKNPPIQPDLKRQIETYTSKVQFVELKFEGSRLDTISVSIPPRALPFKDQDIKKKLSTRMKLFDNLISKDDFVPFLDLKSQVNEIRKTYLTALTSRKDKNILRVDRKSEFLEKIGELKDSIPAAKKQVLNLLENEILNSEERIKKELTTFLTENLPEEFSDFAPDIRTRKIEQYINKLVSSIHFPPSTTILKNVELGVYFYNLTYEDFKDDNLLEEFKEKGIMDSNDLESIVKIKEAFEAKR